MNYTTQEKIRKNLNSGKIDVSHATNDERILYKKIIQNNIVNLKKIINQKHIFGLNLFWGMVSVSLAFFGGSLYYVAIIYPYVIKLGQAKGFLYALPLFMALIFGFLVYKFLCLALYAKKNALSDLLRDEAILAQLEKAE